jgi:hypothetical protein
VFHAFLEGGHAIQDGLTAALGGRIIPGGGGRAVPTGFGVFRWLTGEGLEVFWGDQDLAASSVGGQSSRSDVTANGRFTDLEYAGHFPDAEIHGDLLLRIITALLFDKAL